MGRRDCGRRLIAASPGEVWSIVKKFGTIDIPDLRTAVATCILEHLLEQHFEEFFPLLENEVMGGNQLLGETFLECWKLELADIPKNSAKWDRLEEWILAGKST